MTPPGKNLRSRVATAASWVAANVLSTRLFAFAANVILARLLSPSDFGVVAVAVVVQTVALAFFELGSTVSIARGDRDPSTVAPTVATITLVSGAVVTGAILLGAPILAEVLGNPDATTAIRLISVTVFLSAIASVPAALLWRDFMMKRRARVDILSAAVSHGLAIPFALLGQGALAPISSRVIGGAAGTIGYLISAPARYGFGFKRSEASRILRLGVPVALANLLVVGLLNVDYVVVGRLLNADQLGLYLLAFNLASIPSVLVTEALRSAALPLFGRMHSRGDLHRVVLPTISLLGFAACGVSALIAGLGEPLVQLFYGEEWSAASTAMVGLAVFGAGRILCSVFGDMVVAAGRPGSFLWVQVIWLVLLIPAMHLLVVTHGIAGASAAHALVVWLAVLPIWAALLSRATRIRVRSIASAFAPWVFAGTLAGYAAWWVSGLITGRLAAVLAGGASGLCVYGLLVAPWAIRLRRDLGALFGGFTARDVA